MCCRVCAADAGTARLVDRRTNLIPHLHCSGNHLTQMQDEIPFLLGIGHLERKALALYFARIADLPARLAIEWRAVQYDRDRPVVSSSDGFHEFFTSDDASDHRRGRRGLISQKLGLRYFTAVLQPLDPPSSSERHDVAREEFGSADRLMLCP